MPKNNEPSATVLEESIGNLNMLARHLAGRVQYILDGEKLPTPPQRTIATTIHGERARAYVNSVSCGDGDTIVCEATAIQERDPHTRHEVNLIFRHGKWSIALKRSWAIVDEEDLSSLIDN